MKRLIGMLLVAALGVLASVPAVAAEGAAPSPWSPYRGSDFSVPAGARCDFGVHGHVVADKERIRTLETTADGAPVTQEIVGQLVMELTNLASGRTVVRNFTGTALVHHDGVGGFTLELLGGHMMVGLPADAAGGPGLFGLTGAGHEITIRADGSRTLTLGSGPVEDLCGALSS